MDPMVKLVESIRDLVVQLRALGADATSLNLSTHGARFVEALGAMPGAISYALILERPDGTFALDVAELPIDDVTISAQTRRDRVTQRELAAVADHGTRDDDGRNVRIYRRS